MSEHAATDSLVREVDSLPLVSVCVPTYNNEDTVRRAITSAMIQADSYPHIEVLIVDDDSTDGTLRVVEEFEHNKIVRVKAQNANVGLIANHNSCIELASGSLVKFLHADDELLPGAVAKLVEAYVQSGAALVVAPRNIVSNDPQWTEKYGDVTRPLCELGSNPNASSVIAKFLRQRELKNFFAEPSAVLVATDAARRVGGFDSSYPQLLDLDFCIRLTLTGGLAVVNSPASVRHHSSATATARNRDNPRARYDMVRILQNLARDDRLDTSLRILARARLLALLGRSGLRAVMRADHADMRQFVDHAKLFGNRL